MHIKHLSLSSSPLSVWFGSLDEGTEVISELLVLPLVVFRMLLKCAGLTAPHSEYVWGISGVRSRGMTPEVTQESGRRRTTSEGQYQSGHENASASSLDFANNLALNPGGRPREVRLFTFMVKPRAFDNQRHFTDLHTLHLYHQLIYLKARPAIVCLLQD